MNLFLTKLRRLCFGAAAVLFFSAALAPLRADETPAAARGGAAAGQAAAEAAPQIVPTLPDFSADPDYAMLANRGKYLTVKLAVLGPGDELYLWWGHIGLVIEDALTGENRFYDWGVFSFENNHFFVNFAQGRLLYSCMVSPEDANITRTIHENRDITMYDLDLPDYVKGKIQQLAETNMLPENRDYWYHHFNDNCSTRVRDILDTALGGAFREAYGEAPGRFTLRGHVDRHTWYSPFWHWALSFWMGRGIDRPVTTWTEMFLPSEMGRDALAFRYKTSDGVEHKLVRSVEIVNKAQGRPGVLDVPPVTWDKSLYLGIAVAFLMWGLGWGEKKNKNRTRLLRGLLGSAEAILGLFFGVAGTIAVFLSFFTNHDYAWHNSNVIFVNPILLAAVPLGIIHAFGKNPRRRFIADTVLRSLWTYVFLGGVVTMVIKLSPDFWQQNQVTQGLVMPFAFALSIFPVWIKRLFSGIHKKTVQEGNV